MLEGIEIKLNNNFFNEYKDFEKIARKLVFTGMIDEFFEYRLGILDYRSLYFENKTLDEANY